LQFIWHYIDVVERVVTFLAHPYNIAYGHKYCHNVLQGNKLSRPIAINSTLV